MINPEAADVSPEAWLPLRPEVADLRRALTQLSALVLGAAFEDPAVLQAYDLFLGERSRGASEARWSILEIAIGNTEVALYPTSAHNSFWIRCQDQAFVIVAEAGFDPDSRQLTFVEPVEFLGDIGHGRDALCRAADSVRDYVVDPTRNPS